MTKKEEREAVADLDAIDRGGEAERLALWQTVNDIYTNVLFDLTALEYSDISARETIEQLRFSLSKVIERSHEFYEMAKGKKWGSERSR